MVIEGKLVDCILEGKPFEDEVEAGHVNSMYKTFYANVESLGENNPLDLFGKSEMQRVQIIKQFFQWIPVPEIYFKRKIFILFWTKISIMSVVDSFQHLICMILICEGFQKSSSISASLRDRGNQAYLNEDYEKALRAYNLAISFAKPGEPELGLAYEKRADLFITINEADLAQRDINLAALSAYPRRSAQKLIDLQNRCTSTVTTNRKYLNNIQHNAAAINEARRFCHDKFFRLKNPHPSIQNVEDFVHIDYRSQCGRRVIVTRDVPAGSVMLMDAPYAFMLENLLKWDTEHCHFCTRPVLGGIPCHGCTFAWFCSDSCLANASNGMHRFEHNYLPYLQCHPMAYRIVTAARTLFTAGVDQIYNIFKTKDPLYFLNEKSRAARGFNNVGVYEVNSYLPIFHLISHSPTNFIKDLSDVFKALLMTNLMEQTTNFFRRPTYTPQSSKEDFKDFVASLLLRHMRSFEFNAITLSKLESQICPDPNNNPTTLEVTSGQENSCGTNMKTIRYGAAVYPVLCLLNHSCDPNAVPVRSLKHAKTSVVALKNLKCGDEICISYTPIFTMQDTEERLKYLFDRYNFYCTCDACCHMWSNAKRTNIFGESHCDKCHRYLLTGQCPACAQRDKDMPQLLEQLRMQAGYAEKLMDAKKYKDAEQILSVCLNQCQDASSLFNLYIELQQLYKRALVGLFNQ